ncbi:hypothetical protein B6L71_24055 [Salmonella enterica]|nr:hypothetical protein [Salmonella enterica]ECU5353326.1 hypothetical protein [Salmonella enterica subsp. enterica serovar Berta]EDX7412817.1 hypothetical protein [Salmonella enterica subsp. enterica serovar Berta]EEG4076622.1 hypothetical protein [Salmonella enterica subsp. enterica serovar Newport]EEJ9429349.1 hypothetical protein [Salmonella enterica subsp. enterica serovar Newport]
MRNSYSGDGVFWNSYCDSVTYSGDVRSYSAGILYVMNLLITITLLR